MAEFSSFPSPVSTCSEAENYELAVADNKDTEKHVEVRVS